MCGHELLLLLLFPSNREESQRKLGRASPRSQTSSLWWPWRCCYCRFLFLSFQLRGWPSSRPSSLGLQRETEIHKTNSPSAYGLISIAPVLSCPVLSFLSFAAWDEERSAEELTTRLPLQPIQGLNLPGKTWLLCLCLCLCLCEGMKKRKRDSSS